MNFSDDQKAHVVKQLQEHKRESGVRTIVLDEDANISIELLIEQGVFASDVMSASVCLARFLYKNRGLYQGKDVVDIGCGPGTQGIVMAKYGARSVMMSDVNSKAVINTKKNIERYNLENAIVIESDLFSDLPQNKTYDVIVFNHPFFAGNPSDFEEDSSKDEMLIRKSMLGGTELIGEFLKEAPKYLAHKGVIIMPYFHFAGIENDPANRVEEYGLKIVDQHKEIAKKGAQLGEVSVYVISV